jgi:hypothetical protein
MTMPTGGFFAARRMLVMSSRDHRVTCAHIRADWVFASALVSTIAVAGPVPTVQLRLDLDSLPGLSVAWASAHRGVRRMQIRSGKFHRFSQPAWLAPGKDQLACSRHGMALVVKPPRRAGEAKERT